MSETLVRLAYLASAILFIFGLKGLTHPRKAVQGNFLGALGMLLAVSVTLIDRQIVGYTWILAGVGIGGAIGALLSARVEMTEMPQLVALFNGFGGLASVLVAGAELSKLRLLFASSGQAAIDAAADPALYASINRMTEIDALVAAALGGLIGAITFTGSLVATGKLHGLISSKAILFPNRHAVNIVLGLAVVGLTVAMCGADQPLMLYGVLVVVSLILGVTTTLPIGGADMPVVISLLNSYSGLAACATGFVLENTVLIVAGSLVGASGLILTQIMCKGMNRELFDVLFGVFEASEGMDADAVYAGKINQTSAEELAMIFDGCQRVVIVPGYGLAVAQAQFAVRDMASILTERGITVEYAIHPVAGRMPGHMNVLLAEANIDYEQLKELDEINPTFDQVDMAIVIGANDVVNPLARTDPTSPIHGMPILDVDKARTVIVIKRSLSPGFAGIPNPLFAADNALMLFGDGKKAILDVVSALQEG